MKKERVIKAEDLSGILKPHENKWVALSADRRKVVASVKNFDGVVKSLRKLKQNKKNLAFMKVLPFMLNYAPFNYEI